MNITQLIKEAKKIQAKYGNLEVHAIPFPGRTCDDCLAIRPIIKDGCIHRTFVNNERPYWFMLEFNRDSF